MITSRILSLLFCGCFVIVNSQSTIQTSGECSNDEYLLETVERTCRPTQQVLRTYQQLLHRHEQLLNQVSAKLTNIKGPQITAPGTDVEKQHFVSGLTGKSVGLILVC